MMGVRNDLRFVEDVHAVSKMSKAEYIDYTTKSTSFLCEDAWRDDGRKWL